MNKEVIEIIRTAIEEKRLDPRHSDYPELFESLNAIINLHREIQYLEEDLEDTSYNTRQEIYDYEDEIEELKERLRKYETV